MAARGPRPSWREIISASSECALLRRASRGPGDPPLSAFASGGFALRSAASVRRRAARGAFILSCFFMPSPPPDPLFLRLTGEIRGPFGRKRLRELAETGVITPATEAAEQRDGPWQSVGDLPGGAELFPERARLQFKAREFERLNQNATPPVNHRVLVAAAQERKAPSAATAQRPGDIEEILRLNREREKEA